jgi:hypothetical protein
MSGLGVDLHPYYQRGVTALPGVEYGWIKMADGAYAYRVQRDGQWWSADAHAGLFRHLGIPFGGYVYAQPGDGAAEARVLWNECLRLGGTGVAPACDIESNSAIHIWSTSEAIDHGRAFCAQMRKLGVRPAIYMNDSLAGATQPDTWPEDPVLWIARYGSVPQRTRYDVHQYSSSGSLPGSAGAVDWNQAYTTAHLLTAAAHVQEDDMTPDQDLMLRRVYGQLTGTEDVHANPAFPGFPSKEYPSSFATPVDFVRAMDQNVIRLARAVEALTAKVDALTPKAGA